MLKDVRISERLRARGVTENHRGFPTKYPVRVFGADTETHLGQIYTVQGASEGDRLFRYVTPGTGFKTLFDWVNSKALDDGVNLMFIHNLKYDATVMLSQNQEELYNQYNEIKLTRDGYDVHMFYGRVNTMRVRKDLGLYQCQVCGELPEAGVKLVGSSFYCANPNHGDPEKVKKKWGPTIRVLDSAAFCPPGSKSLVAALKIYGVNHRKMKAPDNLGKERLSGVYFEEYSMNDAICEEGLGLAIVKVHQEYDITPSISLPQLSGRILRHHFFNKGENFKFPPEACRLAAELSYHAGKNGFYVKPGVYEDLYEYDINSAFPKAMVEMPQLVKGKYQHVKKYRQKVMGIYRIEGHVGKRSRYPVVFDAGFKPVRGRYSSEWVTGYEIEILRRAPGNRFRIKEGWIWKHDPGYLHSPLAEFVKRFWDLKAKAPKGPNRDTYKNILNSLYGKFAACVEEKPMVETAYGVRPADDQTGKIFKSGALYHPFIATQITGYVRARLWELETKGQALHAATDSIKSRAFLPSSNDLGGVKAETFGRCYLFRNKLYLHFAKDTSLCGHNLERGWLSFYKEEMGLLSDVGSHLETGRAYDAIEDRWWGKLFDWDGQHLCKVGLHGFKGSAFYLYRNRKSLLRNGFLDYSYQHMVQLREGYKRGEPIGAMVDRQERVTLKELAESI